MATATATATATAYGGERLSGYLKGTAAKRVETNINLVSEHILRGDIDNPVVYARDCWNLGSNIDLAIATNEVPSSSHLPLLTLIFKEVYRRKTESRQIQPPLMVLILSIKGACQNGWFPDKDRDDLLVMAKEVSHGFSDTDKMSIEPSYALSTVSNIISRFYPKLKLESIVTSFDVKAGYGAFVADFHISRGTLLPHHRNLLLLVARLDNMDTSACIVSPPNVDFLLNGRGIQARSRGDMGNGPQLPLNVTMMFKFGVNILQVIGDFDGQYIIVLAFMNSISSTDPPQLQDYVPPVLSRVDSDSDVVEMSSRISLQCPISRDRIKTPVKGNLCKHAQCFDYKNYFELNSRRPTWRCPLCNQPVCHLDIRIDQTIVKILNEVAEDVSDVIISADGSWKGVLAKQSQPTERNINMLSGQESAHQQHVASSQSQTNYVPSNAANLESSWRSQFGGNPCMTQPIRPQDQRHSTWLKPLNLDPLNRGLDSQQQYYHVNESSSARGMPSWKPVNLNTTQASFSLTNSNHTSANVQPHQVQTNRTTQANDGTTDQAQSTNFDRFSGGEQLQYAAHAQSQSQLSPNVTPPSLIQYAAHAQSQSQLSPNVTPPSLIQYAAHSQSQSQLSPNVIPPSLSQYAAHGQSQSQSQLSPNVRPSSLIRETSGDATASVRMRGSLTGDKLEAARLQFLAPPVQPARANEPWSRPTQTIPISLQMQQTFANATNSQK